MSTSDQPTAAMVLNFNAYDHFIAPDGKTLYALTPNKVLVVLKTHGDFSSMGPDDLDILILKHLLQAS